MKTLEEQIEEGSAVKEMMSNSPGWKVIRKIIEDMQEKAFSDWGELDFDAKPEKVAELKFTKRILSKLMEEIKSTVSLGEEAVISKQRQIDGDVQQAMFTAEKSSDSEFEKLCQHIPFVGKIFGREPERASHAGPVNGQPKK